MANLSTSAKHKKPEKFECNFPPLIGERLGLHSVCPDLSLDNPNLSSLQGQRFKILKPIHELSSPEVCGLRS